MARAFRIDGTLFVRADSERGTTRRMSVRSGSTGPPARHRVADVLYLPSFEFQLERIAADLGTDVTILVVTDREAGYPVLVEVVTFHPRFSNHSSISRATPISRLLRWTCINGRSDWRSLPMCITIPSA
jgi:hypothetical protein